MYRSILVPVDGSMPSRKALAVAAELVDRGQGLLFVLNVQAQPLADDTLGHLAGAPAPDADERVQAAGHAVVDSVRKDLSLDSERMRLEVRSGDPAKVITAEAEGLGVDAIVMGSRGVSGVGSLVVGSVSQHVLHAASCTVIVVR